MPSRAPSPSKLTWVDVAFAILLAAGAVAYLTALPRQLNPSDEAVHLYEAKRILNGEVMYRDIFEIIPPGWMYLMALLFRVFGTDMTTARFAMAVIHGLAAAAIALTCRRLGVRAPLAWAAGVAYLAVCPPAWQIASQHWLSTLLCIVLLWRMVAGDRSRRAAAFGMGIALGLLIAVQHPRGTLMAIGTGVILMTDAVVRWRYRVAPVQAPFVTQIAWLAAGGLLILGPLFTFLLATAGFEPVWRALVIHPLFRYAPRAVGTDWGNVNVMTIGIAGYTFPRLLKYLPLALLVSLPRLLWNVLRRRDYDEAHRLTALVISCAASMVSIKYFPDFIHIAFIAPVFFVAIAESAEWTLRGLPRRPRALVPLLALGASGVLVVGAARHLQRNFERLRATHPYRRETAFGRVAFQAKKDALLYDHISALLPQVPSRALFCYPIRSDLYLLADANNPTPFGFFIAGYNPPDQVEEVLAILARRKLPYIVLMFPALPSYDPIIEYIHREYELLPGGEPTGNVIYRRRAARGS